MPISLSNSRNLNLDAGIKPISAFFAVTWHPTKIFNHFFLFKKSNAYQVPGGAVAICKIHVKKTLTEVVVRVLKRGSGESLT